MLFDNGGDFRDYIKSKITRMNEKQCAWFDKEIEKTDVQFRCYMDTRKISVNTDAIEKLIEEALLQ